MNDDPNYSKNFKKAQEQLRAFVEDCDVCSVEADLLEIGSKNAYFVRAAQLHGFKAVGTEVSQTRVQWMNEQYPSLTIVKNETQSLPFRDNSFDFVVSFQVIEHMSHLAAMLNECNRVLRSGGLMYHVCPNYKSFYEGHYRVIWFPFLRKSAGRRYLRLLGRDTRMFDSYVFPVSPSRLESHFSRFSDLKIMSLGRDEFLKRFTIPQIEKVDQRFLRAVLMYVYRLRRFTHPLLAAIAAADFYYPLTVIVRKR